MRNMEDNKREFIGYEYITDESQINTSEYIDARSRGKANKKDPVKYMYLQCVEN